MMNAQILSKYYKMHYYNANDTIKLLNNHKCACTKCMLSWTHLSPIDTGGIIACHERGGVDFISSLSKVGNYSMPFDQYIGEVLRAKNVTSLGMTLAKKRLIQCFAYGRKEGAYTFGIENLWAFDLIVEKN